MEYKEKYQTIPGSKGATLIQNYLSIKNKGLEILWQIIVVILGENMQIDGIYYDKTILSS